MARAAKQLEARRRALIAAYARARKGHSASARISRRLATVTCDLLRAEIRAARNHPTVATREPDLFSDRAAA
ncbi:hypothetical protein V5G24_23195 [Xanthobacter sp. VTT E-85241]|uniref:hypothetical protein n=1 Tax=Roseixanthobacter finlandensis TaxID=3119922 RepID=UPI00372B9DD4